MWIASEWKGESSPTKIRVRHCNFFNPSVMSCLLHTCLASSSLLRWHTFTIRKVIVQLKKSQLKEQGHTRWLLEEILKHLCPASHPATVVKGSIRINNDSFSLQYISITKTRRRVEVTGKNQITNTSASLYDFRLRNHVTAPYFLSINGQNT